MSSVRVFQRLGPATANDRSVTVTSQFSSVQFSSEEVDVRCRMVLQYTASTRMGWSRPAVYKQWPTKCSRCSRSNQELWTALNVSRIQPFQWPFSGSVWLAHGPSEAAKEIFSDCWNGSYFTGRVPDLTSNHQCLGSEINSLNNRI